MNPYTDRDWLILTAEQADEVAGVVDGLGIDPVPLLDGTFAVPGGVTADPRYAGRFGAVLPGATFRPLVPGVDFAEPAEE